MAYWRCTVCGYVHNGDEPPMICPKCGVGHEEFEAMEGMDERVEPESYEQLWEQDDREP